MREFGNRPKAEDALAARQKRMEKIQVHPLSHEERDRFADQWHDIQARFVDDPPGSIEQADRLVCDVMKARGYPMSEFEHRAEDLSVDHPHVVRNYRAAHQIAMRHEQGQASTEDLRQGLVYYRDLFDELVGGPRRWAEGAKTMNQVEEHLSTADFVAGGQAAREEDPEPTRPAAKVWPARRVRDHCCRAISCRICATAGITSRPVSSTNLARPCSRPTNSSRRP